MENRENAHFMLPSSLRQAIRMVAAKTGKEQSEVVEEALLRYAPIKVVLVNGKEKR